MKKTRTMLFAAAFAAFLAVPAAAQTNTIGIYSYPNPQVVWNGVYVGPYQLSIGGPGGYSIDAVCVDYLHEISIPETWTANFTNLGGTPDFSLTRAAGLQNAMTLYREAAWLSTQFATASVYSWGNIHGTIWNLFLQAAGKPLLTTSGNWLTLAEQNYSQISPSAITVITPVTTDPLAVDWSSSSPQEFITLADPPQQQIVTVTPEPQVYVLLGTGLLLLGMLYIKRQRAVLSA